MIYHNLSPDETQFYWMADWLPLRYDGIPVGKKLINSEQSGDTMALGDRSGAASDALSFEEIEKEISRPLKRPASDTILCPFLTCLLPGNPAPFIVGDDSEAEHLPALPCSFLDLRDALIAGEMVGVVGFLARCSSISVASSSRRALLRHCTPALPSRARSQTRRSRICSSSYRRLLPPRRQSPCPCQKRVDYLDPALHTGIIRLANVGSSIVFVESPQVIVKRLTGDLDRLILRQAFTRSVRVPLAGLLITELPTEQAAKAEVQSYRSLPRVVTPVMLLKPILS